MITISTLRAGVPGPHYAPRMQYRFPWMVSQGPAIGARPTPKGPGPDQGIDYGARGASAIPVQLLSGLHGLGQNGDGEVVRAPNAPRDTLAGILSVAGALSIPVLAYHGYARNESIGWALVWGVFGSLFWPVTVPIALAQGYGRRARRR